MDPSRYFLDPIPDGFRSNGNVHRPTLKDACSSSDVITSLDNLQLIHSLRFGSSTGSVVGAKAEGGI